MKIFRSLNKPRRQKGSATLVVLTLLSIMVVLETAEFAAARHLDSDLRLIEKRQLLRLNRSSPKQTTILGDHQFHG
ncbi:MAG TPA: hypothetical protein VN048_05520 [Verrucomicrobiae bacterium]|jgi:hypothetical protein|nr:hypothetical protein [Verrucomicrobiae bacterium]